MNFPSCKNIAALTFFHTCTVTRKAVAEGANHESVLSNSTIYTAIKCTLSARSVSTNNIGRTDIENRIEADFVLFTKPEYTIKAGDSIVVTLENAATKTVIAGEPNFFVSHIEVPVTIIKRA
jgi:hypothetical protein